MVQSHQAYHEAVPITRGARSLKPPLLAQLAALAALLPLPVFAQAPPNDAARYRPAPEEMAAIQARTNELGRLLDELRLLPPIDPGHPKDAFAEVAVYHKAALW